MRSPLDEEQADLASWALFSFLGTESQTPVILVPLESGIDSAGRSVPANPAYEKLEGRLVAITGQYADGAFSKIDTVVERQVLSQRQLELLGNVVRPGSWWQEWSLGQNEFWEMQQSGTPYPSLDAVRPPLSFRAATPDHPALGRLLGVFGDDFSGPEYRGAVLVYNEGFTLGVTPAANANQTFPELNDERLGRLRQGPRPPYPSAVDINGHLGELQGIDEHAVQLSWRDDEAVYVLMHISSGDGSTTGQELLDIARSCYR